MANYDRKILIPYLQDVCSTELLCDRLKKEVYQCNCDVKNLWNVANQTVVDPAYPQKSDFPVDELGSNIACAIFGGVIALAGLLIQLLIHWSLFEFIIKIVSIGLMVVGGLLVLLFVSNIRSSFKERNCQYLRAVEKCKECVELNRTIRDQIPQYKTLLYNSQQELAIRERRLQDAEELRENVYRVNIIPGKYRDKYVAYYLYDYFSTSRETDLDKIIQTLLLDEIKEKLDKIIAQNEEIILSQRIQIALQEQQNRTIAENHREMLRHIARLEQNQELQIDYQNMIEQNQRVTNFILAADYLQKD